MCDRDLLIISYCHLIKSKEWCHRVKHVNVQSKMMCDTRVHVLICFSNSGGCGNMSSHCRVRKF